MENLQAFRNYLIEDEKSKLTVEKYLRDVRALMAWLGERSLTKTEVMRYKSHLVDHYAITSLNSMLSALNTYFDYIGRADCKVKIIKTQRSAFCPRSRELNCAEYKRLLQAANHDKRLALLMQTIAATGIRVSEHRHITVEAARRGIAQVHCKGKVRQILLPHRLCAALLKYAKKRGIKDGSIFIGKNGAPLDRSRIWAQMKKLCQAADVLAEKVFPHNLRHLFARTFYSMEKDIVRLADILGHSSVNTTRIYTIESGQVHRRQMEKIPLIFIT